MNILVCVKRVPDIGAWIDLSDDRQTIIAKNLDNVTGHPSIIQ
ncbi:MAG: hypothetical protein ACYTA5_25715 [Planctomycetota bacterium]|jgi:hypothetical protein